VDDPDSRVDIVATAVADLKGIARLGRALGTGRLPLGRLREQLGRQPLPAPVAGVPAGMTGQLLRFAGIGVASTVAYLLLYALLRTAAGPQLANLLALLVTAVANTAANRRLTFGVRGTERAGRHQVQGLVIFTLGLGLTSGCLAALHAASARPPRAAELAVLIVANLTATVLRFLLLRVWVFRVGQDPHGDSRGTAGEQARSGTLVRATPSPVVATGSGATAPAGPIDDPTLNARQQGGGWSRAGSGTTTSAP
jgi:putative flippase GtrA